MCKLEQDAAEVTDVTVQFKTAVSALGTPAEMCQRHMNDKSLVNILQLNVQ